ncbi:Beta-galactosidase [Quillaja saponaria]|uniref:beta-galactosidase n=1 Tax=Quillaja saponaria TaxID=32244 RepID=A0AAD7LRJ4_QUISA|nr:Beta-galactosidase [Quillaja saponaria]
MSTTGIGILLVVSLALQSSSSVVEVSYDANAIIINGERKIIMSGAIHYPRSTPEMWPDLIQEAKEGGLDAIETYIFWDKHEPVLLKYDFSGNLELIKFFKLIQEAGLYAVMRIGPYVCAEWNYGGFPLWLHNMPGIQLRKDNTVYKNEMQIFTTKVVNLCKEAKLFAPQGGPIIMAQKENEYRDVAGRYGEAGKSYIKWAAQMAVGQNIGVPWIMCKYNEAPQPMINTCNGFYCDNFTPNNPKSPKMFTENWLGWFQKWGERAPHRTAGDVSFSVARFVEKGGVFNNYYMYHGGTSFGRTSGDPYIMTSYDYDAPLDEYGNVNQSKWGHLRDLHAAIKSGEKIITSGIRTEKKYDEWVY